MAGASPVCQCLGFRYFHIQEEWHCVTGAVGACTQSTLPPKVCGESSVGNMIQPRSRRPRAYIQNSRAFRAFFWIPQNTVRGHWYLHTKFFQPGHFHLAFLQCNIFTQFSTHFLQTSKSCSSLAIILVKNLFQTLLSLGCFLNKI